MDDQQLERAYQEGARHLERYGSLPSWRELPQGAKDALAGAIDGGREDLRRDFLEALGEALETAEEDIVDAVIDATDLDDATELRAQIKRILEVVAGEVDRVR